MSEKTNIKGEKKQESQKQEKYMQDDLDQILFNIAICFSILFLFIAFGLIARFLFRKFSSQYRSVGIP